MLMVRTTRKQQRHWPRRRGAAAVEMAFVAPFVFLLVFTSFEFARMMMVRQAMTNAAREGCRNAALATTLNDDQSEAVVRQQLSGVVPHVNDTDILRVSVTPAFEDKLSSGTRITTTVEIDCEDVSWLPPMFFSGMEVQGTASMTRE